MTAQHRRRGLRHAVADNPLRDPQDRRLPRIAGPCGLVIFGVTGDLARKKLMPAVYDLANRGLLPPGFALVGFARRDWEHQDFERGRARRGQGARPYAVPRGGLEAARRGHPVRPRRASTTTRRSSGCATPSTSSTSERGTERQPRLLPVDPAEAVPDVVSQLKKHGLADGSARAAGAGW